MSRRSFWAWGLEQDEPTEQQVREAAARLSQRYGVAVEPVMPPRAEDLQLRAPRISPPSSLGRHLRHRRPRPRGTHLRAQLPRPHPRLQPPVPQPARRGGPRDYRG